MAKIFLVDDDTDIILLFEQFLSIRGHTIVAKAYNGEEAIKIFKDTNPLPDIILMDHRMPLKNGLETTKEILSINSNTKIIFTSADYTVRNKALDIGAVDFLEKPIGLNFLNEMIEKYSPDKIEVT
ncbi:MAG: response regulator [Promethearchaeota archaeon]|jgi:two-component system chemotaxis response regulator CheY